MNTRTAEVFDLEPIDPQPAAPESASRALAVATPAHLLQLAVEQGRDLAYVEKLMALQERWQANEARKAYAEAFAAFKAEAVQVVRTKKITDGPLKGKKHAELSGVVAAATAALSKHGLSAAWRLSKDDRDWIEVTCTVSHVAGHSESVFMGGPPDTGPGRNAIQARVSTKTYLERTTMMAILGLAAQDEDDDGAGGAKAIGEVAASLVDQYLEKLKVTKTDAEAASVWADGSKAIGATKNMDAYNEFKNCVVAHRTRLKGAQQ